MESTGPSSPVCGSGSMTEEADRLVAECGRLSVWLGDAEEALLPVMMNPAGAPVRLVEVGTVRRHAGGVVLDLRKPRAHGRSTKESPCRCAAP
jgi:hypothetical protein